MNSTPQRRERERGGTSEGETQERPKLCSASWTRFLFFLLLLCYLNSSLIEILFSPHILERYSSRCFQCDDAVMHFGQTNSPRSLPRIICSLAFLFIFLFSTRFWSFYCNLCVFLGSNFKTRPALMELHTWKCS